MACKYAELVFVGPSPEAIRVMGHKDEAKKLMESAGVPVVPGCNDLDIDLKILMSEARKVGYPVLIKAAAGGGGGDDAGAGEQQQLDGDGAGGGDEAKTSEKIYL